MPELPEVETTRRDLAERIRGRAVTGVSFADGGPLPVRDMEPEAFAAAIRGRVFGELERRGKYLIAHLEGGDALVLHRRMTGNLLSRRPDDPPDAHTRAIIHLDDGAELRWTDLRRFGRWQLTTDPASAYSGLGPEPLGDAWFVADLAAALRGRAAPIKAVLLDQRRVAGLGNIYADESLHQARIHPLRPAGSLTDAEMTRLHQAIRSILLLAIEQQGSSMRDHVGGLGQRGTMQERWHVYGRAGQTCRSCGAVIEKSRVAGRGTHICPDCQPSP